MTDEHTTPVSLDAEFIIAEAMKQTGLDDFGDLPFRLPMEKLLWSLEHEADLSQTGRGMQRQRLVNILSNNLRMQYFLKEYPEIRNQLIVAPLVILGLPRTGTTMLHRIIAADGRLFAAQWFEVRNPSPYLDWGFSSTTDRRIGEAKSEVAAMLESSPDLTAAHPMDAMSPDEDILLMEHSFYSTTPESFANVPSYGHWLEQQDQTVAYEYLKLQLQFLQWQKMQAGQQARRWVLKTPHHLHFMDLLFKVFPDAKVVQTHRDPLQTIPSVSSLIHAIWLLASNNADPKAVGHPWARKFANGMKHIMQVRKQLPPDRFLDLWFKDSVSQPMRQIEKVYDFIGLDLTAEARAAMAVWQEQNRRDSRPPHEYTLEEFGITAEELMQQFAEYREQFIINR